MLLCKDIDVSTWELWLWNIEADITVKHEIHSYHFRVRIFAQKYDAKAESVRIKDCKKVEQKGICLKIQEEDKIDVYLSTKGNSLWN